jgi:hypothetical protein
VAAREAERRITSLAESVETLDSRERLRRLARLVRKDGRNARRMAFLETAIGECLAANRIDSIRGILNGTSNFILSTMEEEGADYADVLALAQAKGYAEADPSMDVDGTDATQKLAILAHLAFLLGASFDGIGGVESRHGNRRLYVSVSFPNAKYVVVSLLLVVHPVMQVVRL